MNRSINATIVMTIFFGMIHGLGFSNYFKTILPGKSSDKILPLCEFSIGIEAAQMIVVLTILLLSFVAHSFFKASKKGLYYSCLGLYCRRRYANDN